MRLVLVSQLTLQGSNVDPAFVDIMSDTPVYRSNLEEYPNV